MRPSAARSLRRQRLVSMLGALLAGALTSACATSIDLELSGGGSIRVEGDAETTPGPESAVDSGATPTPEPRPELTYDEALDSYLVAIEAYWATAMPDTFGQSFLPVERMVPYSPSDESSIPACDDEFGPLELYRDNAFYCEPDDYIAWDDEGLFPSLYEGFGDFSVGLVLGHEYGHAVQARVGLDGPDIYVELQADCFAGGWAATLLGSEDRLGVTSADLDGAMSGFLTFADPVSTPSRAAGAHGTAFDRLAAFADGLDAGAAACADYLRNPPDLTTLRFDPADANGGNLPLDALLPELLVDLELLYDELAEAAIPAAAYPGDPVEYGGAADDPPACGSVEVHADDVDSGAYYCEADDTVYLDRGMLEELWEQAGDFAPSYLVLQAYGVAAVLADDDERSAADTVVTADCVAGTWSRRFFDNASVPPDADELVLSLSAGDLDEGIVGLLAAPPAGPSLEPVGALSAFRRAAAFRLGFFDGVVSCGL